MKQSKLTKFRHSYTGPSHESIDKGKGNANTNDNLLKQGDVDSVAQDKDDKAPGQLEVKFQQRL
jgi:hypothetical protein